MTTKDIRERLREMLKMRFLTVDYKDKQEVYETSTVADTGTIALEILNIPEAILEELLELTEPMMKLVDFLNNNRNANSATLAMMLTASKNVFRVVDLLRDVPPFCYQDFAWLDAQLPKIFSPEKVRKMHKERKEESGELFLWAMCLVAQLGFGVRDFQQALIPLVESLDDEDVSRNPTGFARQFDAFFSADEHRQKYWMSITNVSVEYLPGDKGLVRRMHYASFPSMFRSNLYEALAVGNAPKRCPICEKFFLTTNARRQVYCDGYAPEEYGETSCRQVGNRLGRAEREQAQNNPILILYYQVVNVIDQRVSRGTLDKGIAEKAKTLARDYRAMAVAMPDYANGDYKTDTNPDSLIAAVTEK